MAELYSPGVTRFHNKSLEMLLNNVNISFSPDLFNLSFHFVTFHIREFRFQNIERCLLPKLPTICRPNYDTLHFLVYDRRLPPTFC